MTDTSEFVNGKHWADVIGCDMRARLEEIKRAAGRRADEAIAQLRGPELSAALLEINDAIEAATRAKPKTKATTSRAQGEEIDE